MINLREYTLLTVRHALLIELPGEDIDQLGERAEGLIAITEANHLRIESLLDWIHTDAPEKEWSLAEFRAFCKVVTS